MVIELELHIPTPSPPNYLELCSPPLRLSTGRSMPMARDPCPCLRILGTDTLVGRAEVLFVVGRRLETGWRKQNSDLANAQIQAQCPKPLQRISRRGGNLQLCRLLEYGLANNRLILRSAKSGNGSDSPSRRAEEQIKARTIKRVLRQYL